MPCIGILISCMASYIFNWTYNTCILCLSVYCHGACFGNNSFVLWQSNESIEASAKDIFEENYKELIKWVDAKSAKYGTLTVLREKRCGRPGTALKVCSAYQVLTCSYVIFMITVKWLFCLHVISYSIAEWLLVQVKTCSTAEYYILSATMFNDNRWLYISYCLTWCLPVTFVVLLFFSPSAHLSSALIVAIFMMARF